MITLEELYNALSKNEQTIDDLKAENRVFVKLIDIEKSKEVEEVSETDIVEETI
jgi:hypothetical protein